MLAVASLEIHTAELHVRAAQSNLFSAYASLAHQDSPQAAELLQEALASLNAAQGKLTSGHQTYLVSNAEETGGVVQKQTVQRSAWDWMTGSESESATEGQTGATEEDTSQPEVGGETTTGGSAGAMDRVNAAISSVISAHNWLMIYKGGAAPGSHSDDQATLYYTHASAEIGAAQGESSAALVQLLSEQAG